jgi:hypothetical protein
LPRGCTLKESCSTLIGSDNSNTRSFSTPDTELTT